MERIEHKITVEQILALLQGKQLFIKKYDLPEIVLYPPQDILTFSREEIELIKRNARWEVIEMLEKKEEDKLVDVLMGVK